MRVDVACIAAVTIVAEHLYHLKKKNSDKESKIAIENEEESKVIDDAVSTTVTMGRGLESAATDKRNS